MTFKNLCSSCTNIGCEFQSGIIRTKCAFYMPQSPHIEPDNCGNYIVMQPTVKSIPIPNNATNGDIIKALFPKIDDNFSNVIDLKLWWNTKYKTESEE